MKGLGQREVNGFGLGQELKEGVGFGGFWPNPLFQFLSKSKAIDFALTQCMKGSFLYLILKLINFLSLVSIRSLRSSPLREGLRN